LTVEAPSTDEPHRPGTSESPIEGAPERLAGFIYGTLVALAMIVAGVKVYPGSPGRIAVFVVLTSFVLWLFCEVAIVACNLAEVIGMAIGLNLLFGLPLVAGVVVTLLDVMLLLSLQNRGFRGGDGSSRSQTLFGTRNTGDTPATTVNRLALHKLSDEIF